LGADGKTWPEASRKSPVTPGGGELEGDSHAPSIDADRACVNPPPGLCSTCGAKMKRRMAWMIGQPEEEKWLECPKCGRQETLWVDRGK